MDPLAKNPLDVTILGDAGSPANPGSEVFTGRRVVRKASLTLSRPALKGPIAAAMFILPVSYTSFRLLSMVGLSFSLTNLLIGLGFLAVLLAVFGATTKLLRRCAAITPQILAILSALLSVYYLLLDPEPLIEDTDLGWPGLLCAIAGILLFKLLVQSESRLVSLNSGLTYLILLLWQLARDYPARTYMAGEVILGTILCLCIVAHSAEFFKADSGTVPILAQFPKEIADSPHLIRTELESIIGRTQKIKQQLDNVTHRLQFDSSLDWLKSCSVLCDHVVQNVLETNEVVTISVDKASPADLAFLDEYCGLSAGIKTTPLAPAPITQQVTTILECANFGLSTSFEALELRKFGCGALRLIGDHAFLQYKFVKLGLTSDWCTAFFEGVQAEHMMQPFHCPVHAISVAHHLMLESQRPVLRETLTSLDWFILLIAGLTHDISHPGVTNNCLVSTGSSAAIEFNDRSVLEHMSLSTVLSLIERTSYLTLDFEWWTYVRKQLSELILALDIHRHFELIAQFKLRSSQKLSSEKQLVMQIMLKLADWSFTFRPQKSYLEWSNMLLEEFHSQGDLERRQGLAISMYCDRTNDTANKLHAGVIRYISMPLLQAWLAFASPEELSALQTLKKNLALRERSKERRVSRLQAYF